MAKAKKNNNLHVPNDVWQVGGKYRNRVDPSACHERADENMGREQSGQEVG